ncbi:MAG: glycoside hydrolase family 3 C-terminal domain-containing protein [Prevotella sp.]|nr:glycoside hydrolase family 3 C-terminal domain-containing protein [Prevotella sp.]MCI2087113.1 glycoside hydrolase family 3 C-terminal domain-containing protein [Prevotella sp.]MCI2124194.1 glycoside hydrolase family 3 C-terminal domain-containing protein [Prevotella sp.]
MMKIKNLVAIFLLCGSSVGAQTPVYLDSSAPIEQRVEDVLSRMTLREKIRIIHAQSKFSSAGVPRLGIPDFWTDDGPMGVRPNVLWDEWEQAGQSNDSCVAFPALTCLAATWNPDLSRQYGTSLGEEALYRGKDMLLGPGVNIYRTPLGGRNFEFMGEDPYLASSMDVPYIQGLQSNGVSACVKHFALNNDEENRFNVNVIVSDRALHEIYLPAFEAAVKKGHAWAVMGSYNLYKDEHNCHNEYLLNQILKQDWHFDGVVVSDWGGVHNTDQAVKNGLDMEFGTWTNGLTTGTKNAYDNYYLADPYLKGISEGKYTTKELNDKVRRVLRLFFRTIMAPDRGHGFLCSEDHYATARKVGDDGIVLLQNKREVLPLKVHQIHRVLVVGENAIKMMTVGGGSSSLKVQREISPLVGLKKALHKLNPSLMVEYERGYVGDTTGSYNGVTTGQSLVEHRSGSQLITDAVAKARGADAVILFGGLNKSDHQDCEGHDRLSYELPYGQDKLAEALAQANRNFVFVDISGNAVAMPWKNQVSAIVQAWYLGSEAGDAIADVLTGKVNPSGKLPFTWPTSLEDVGAYRLNAYPGIWRPDHQIIDETYKEGIYVGYRWVDHAHIHPLFAFGHGLSYTTFRLSGLRASARSMTPDGTITFTVRVKNTGKRDGAETVQLYVHENRCSVDRPYKELKGFRKIFLKAGESRDVSITIDRSALSFWDENSNGWKAEKGDFEVLVGDASDHLPLKLAFKLI